MQRASLEIRESTLADNVVTSSGDSRGGAVAGTGSTISIQSSTISRNISMLGAALDASLGGGGDLDPTSTASITASTIADNDGIWSISSSSSSITIKGSIVTPRVGKSCSGPVGSGGWNVTADSTCGLATSTDATANPLLDTLASNGGPTRTTALFQNSPARDAIPVGTPGLCDAATPADQRGAPRPSNGACDSGSLEGDNGRQAVPLNMTVTSTADRRDIVPGDGSCDDGTAHCTVRAALDETAAYPTADTIELGSGALYQLARPGMSDDLNDRGDLDVWGDLTIHGNGSVLSGAQLDRVLHHRGGRLAMTDVTIRDGSILSGDSGGGVLSTGAGLELTRVNVIGNSTSSSGGGIVVSGTLLLVTDSTITDNITTMNDGGGLKVVASVVELRHTTVARNTASYEGGGLSVHSGELSVSDSLITDNRAAFGGGINTIGGTLTIEQTTLSGNSAIEGGAIKAAGLQMNNSTVSGNTAGTASSPANGGAVSTEHGTISSSTITDNIGSNALYYAGTKPPTSLVITSSIISSTTGSGCNRTVSSGNWNVVGDSTCSLNGSADLQNTGAALTPLADNGGSTPTHLPSADSLVVDRIPAGTAGRCDATTPTDQRGFPRPVGPGCDVGAVEGAGPPLAPLNLIVNTGADGVDQSPGDGICDSGGGACTLRAAISESNAHAPGAVVTIATGVNPTLSRGGQDEDYNLTGDLDVRQPLVVHGNGQTVDGGRIDRVIDLHSATLILDNIVVRGGQLASKERGGGGIRALGGSLIISNSTITDNRLLEGAGTTVAAGGGIEVSGATLDLAESTVSLNSAYANGGGIAADGGALVHVRQSLIDHNSASVGGGLYQKNATTTFESSTFSANQATQGSAIVRDYAANSGSLTISASTIADHVGTYTIRGLQIVLRGSIVKGPANLCSVEVVSQGYNIATDGTCGLTAPTDRPSSDPLIGPLSANGGPTLTHATLSGSSARDAIPIGTNELCSGALVDQRGVIRPTGAACDIGALES